MRKSSWLHSPYIGCRGVHRHVHPDVHGAVDHRDGRGDPPGRRHLGGSRGGRSGARRRARLWVAPEPGSEPRHGRVRPPTQSTRPTLRGRADAGVRRRRVPRQGPVPPTRWRACRGSASSRRSSSSSCSPSSSCERWPRRSVASFRKIGHCASGRLCSLHREGCGA
jgi:hypothetical protein